MKIVLQRVVQASVTVDEQVLGRIGTGVLLYVGFGNEDTDLASALPRTAEKIANLRIFPDERGRFHFSLLDNKGGVLLIPNFTLYGDTSKGRRPEFFGALPPEVAAKAFEDFAQCFRSLGIETTTGRFGAHMFIESINDGPVNMVL